MSWGEIYPLWHSLSAWFKERAVDLLITLVGLVLVILATGYVHFLAPASLERHSKVVAIQAGMGFRDIARVLEENAIIRDRSSFYLLARIEEAIPKVKAGEYEMNTNMTPRMVLSKLVRGDVIKYPITIPEGFTLQQIGEILHQAGVCAKNIFFQKVRDPSLVASLELDGDSLEGYLFPDTYNFPKGLGEELVIRLQRGMALQSDPTAVYGWKMGKANKERITKEDLLRKTPYNTYQFSGLPKGPIANPGFKSLHAVLHPADVNYLYFVSKNDRTHYFSHTLAEHNRAVARYQKRSKKDPNPPDPSR
jgi:UPF0755 protein